MAKKKLNRSAFVRDFLQQNPDGSADQYNCWAPPAARMTSGYFHNLKSTIRRRQAAAPSAKKKAFSEPVMPAVSQSRKLPAVQEVRASYTERQLHAARNFAEEFGDFEAAIGALKTVQSLFATGLSKVADIV